MKSSTFTDIRSRLSAAGFLVAASMCLGFSTVPNTRIVADETLDVRGDERSDADVAAFYADLEPDVRAYIAHVTTLANPFFEGRAPGTNGNRVAAQYIEFWFRYFNLEPAFPEYDSEGAVIGDDRDWVSFRQPFDVPGTLKAVRENMTYTTADGQEHTLRAGRDFHALGVGDGQAAGPLTFVGYGISGGPDGYDSFGDVDLSGRVAVLLRFEPSDEDGLSQWRDGREGWSAHAALETKFLETARRGASAIILVNPPDTHDSRTKELMSAEDSSWRRAGVPVVQVSLEVGDQLLRQASDGRSLAKFKSLADEADSKPIALSDDVVVSIDSELNQGRAYTDNVGGVLRGKGELADEWIIIGAHYDHVGYGNFGSLGGRTAAGTIHPGADDNASGTSAVLLLAQRLSQAYRAMDADANIRSILFMTFSAEESGLVGSRYYTRHPTLGADEVNIMLNLDMVGRMRNEKLEVSGIGTAEGLADRVQPFFDRSGLRVRSQETGAGPSDHASFFGVGIPVLFFFTGLHAEYHRPTDVASLINPVGAVRIVDLAQSLIMEFAQMPEQLEFVRARGGFRLDLLDADDDLVEADSPGSDEADTDARPRRITVRLGIQPDYESEESGIMLAGVSEDSAAAKAGLRSGDRIVRWANEEVSDIRALMGHLGRHSPGDEVRVEVIRDGQRVEVTVTLEEAGG